MATAQPSVGFLLLDQVGLLENILPELTALKGIEEIEGQTHKDNFYHTLRSGQHLPTTGMYGCVGPLCCMILARHPPKILKKNGWTFMPMSFRRR